MNSIKKLFVLSALFILCLGYSDNLFARGNGNGNGNGGNEGKFPNAGNNNGGGSVGAPIDGGLLSILGAAGVGYFVIRRKNNKKNQE